MGRPGWQTPRKSCFLNRYIRSLMPCGRLDGNGVLVSVLEGQGSQACRCKNCSLVSRSIISICEGVSCRMRCLHESTAMNLFFLYFCGCSGMILPHPCFGICQRGTETVKCKTVPSSLHLSLMCLHPSVPLRSWSGIRIDIVARICTKEMLRNAGLQLRFVLKADLQESQRERDTE